MSAIDFSHLTVEERLDLIGELCDSLENEALPISEALAAELDRRDATFEEDKRHAVPWSEVRASLWRNRT
ncbi:MULTISPECIES: addiction module protein [Nitrospirillum]|uniref:Putative addiction module component (TIGR02574 family) n=1 Tax=Nitrospirillum amazonense TaxID=28077 RepID=A0A560FZ59_9PROT|nr:addiction module protein [Nitrospirillum amazonense]MEC4592396.1 addiction module protein [Nitrospirillum amazonense]TWB26926.1 putative addiction module component (TIGR02574 family) [Nitrospirillum amazonense]TWB73359.1 putative addiction module component (TIGR02574 family) [Nitrospirillum amazonense]